MTPLSNVPNGSAVPTDQTPPSAPRAVAGPAVARGERVSSAEETEFAALVALQDPAAASRRLDEFAKWIFGGTTVVGALLIGLAGSGTLPTRGAGQAAHVVALLCLGASLALAATSLAPRWAGFNRHSPEQRRAAVDEGLAARRGPLQWAARLFAAALVTAGLTPLGSAYDARRERAPRLGVAYALPDSGPLTATLSASGFPPGSAIELTLEPAEARHAGAVGATTSLLDPNAATPRAATPARTTRRAPLYPRVFPRARAVVGAGESASVAVVLHTPTQLASAGVRLLARAGARTDTVLILPARPTGPAPAALPPVTVSGGAGGSSRPTGGTP